jgi:hypothetical protein
MSGDCGAAPPSPSSDAAQFASDGECGVATGEAWRGYLSERRWNANCPTRKAPISGSDAIFHTARVMFAHGHGLE